MRLCSYCPQDDAFVNANFTFSNAKIGPVAFKMPLVHMGYRTTVVQHLIPIIEEDISRLTISTNSSAITLSTLDLEVIMNDNSTYEVELSTVIIGFQCINV